MMRKAIYRRAIRGIIAILIGLMSAVTVAAPASAGTNNVFIQTTDPNPGGYVSAIVRWGSGCTTVYVDGEVGDVESDGYYAVAWALVRNCNNTWYWSVMGSANYQGGPKNIHPRYKSTGVYIHMCLNREGRPATRNNAVYCGTHDSDPDIGTRTSSDVRQRA